MRGLRGLLVVRTFNTRLFASTFSFQTHLFSFPFSLAVALQSPSPSFYYLPIYRQCRYCSVEEWIFMGLLLKILVARANACCWDYTLSQKAYPPLYLFKCASILCYMVPYCPNLGLLNTFRQCMAHRCNTLHKVLHKHAKCITTKLRALSRTPWQCGKLLSRVLHIFTERYRSAHSVLRWTSWHHLWLFGRGSKGR